MTLQPGDRVAWTLEPDEEDDGTRGTIRDPRQDELDYLATCASSFQASVHGHVIVVWDHDEQDGAWCDPDQLRPAP